MNDITIQQMEIFVAVAERESLSGAAKKMYIDTASVSRWISRLEKTLNTSLFIRTNHGVELTDDGKFLYAELKPMLKRVQSTMRNIRRVYDIPEKVLRVGCLESEVTIDTLSQIIVNFEKNHPEIIVNVECCDLRELRDNLICDNFDCIICLEPELGDYRDIDKKKVLMFDSCFAISRDHPAASGDILDTSQLNDITFFRVVPVEKEESEKRLLALCLSWGFTPREFKYLANREMLKLAIKHNKGIAICGSDFGREYWPDIKVYKVKETFSEEFIVMAWHKYQTSDVTKEFLDSIDEVSENNDNSNQQGF